MLQSPVSPESPAVKHGARAFSRIHNYEAGLEVAENQNREKNDLDPVVVLNSPVDTDSPLYITHGRWAEAPQPIDSTSPQAMGDAALESHRAPPAHQEQDAATVENGSTLADSEKTGPKRWCGLGRNVLLLIILLILLLVGAIIGGAVGGTQAKKTKSSPAQATPSQTTSSSPSQTTSSPSTLSTTTPHVRFRLQTYANYNYTGTLQIFTDPGLFAPAFPIYSYTWTPARAGDYDDAALLRCSVAFCANQTLLGWWGASEKYQPGAVGANHSTNFLHVACDRLNVNPECGGLDGVGVRGETREVVSLVPSTVGGTTGTATGESTARGTTTTTKAAAEKTGTSARGRSTGGAGSGTSSAASASRTGAGSSTSSAARTQAG